MPAIAPLKYPSLKLATVATSNTKTAKPARFKRRRILSALLHLSPANRSGYETCGSRTKGCSAACLDTAGHGGIGAQFDDRGVMLKSNGVQDARIRRTRLFFEMRPEFMAKLVRDIEAVVRKAKEQNAAPAFRPNATSDIDYTATPCTRNGRTFASIFDAFPTVNFYDYTKDAKRFARFLRGELPRNYHLTFSRAETMANQIAAMQFLEAGGNVAAVFSTKPGEALPDMWNGHLVIDGDAHDFRFIDPRAGVTIPEYTKGYIIGLRSKGKAKRDLSGFVIQVAPAHPWHMAGRSGTR